MDLAEIVNTPEVLEEVAYENEEFNLFDFFEKEKTITYGKGACGFITRNQYFYCYAPSFHSYVFENVCSSIFDDGDMTGNVYGKLFTKYHEMNGKENSPYDDTWRYANKDFGVISIQLVSNEGACIWLPEKINSFQKEKILKFCEDIQRINKNALENNYPKVQASFTLLANDGSYKEYEMESFINQIDKFVDDNCQTFHENMISDYTKKSKRI